MSDLPQLAGAPVEVELGGRVLKLRPLTLREMAEFERWYQCRKLEAAKEALGEDATPRDRVELIKAFIGDLNPMEVYEAMSTIVGQVQLLYLALRADQPDMTPDDAGALVNMQNYKELDVILDKLMDNGVVKDAEGEGEGGPPAKKRVRSSGVSR